MTVDRFLVPPDAADRSRRGGSARVVGDRAPLPRPRVGRIAAVLAAVALAVAAGGLAVPVGGLAVPTGGLAGAAPAPTATGRISITVEISGSPATSPEPTADPTTDPTADATQEA
ncbi:MAG TPA: hypothetical protein VF755_04470, partial [Catenuloplanes sp.]